MTEKKKRKAAFILAFLVAVAAVAAAAERSSDSINRLVQQSKFSQQDKADLQARVSTAAGAGISAEDVEVLIARGMKRGASAAEIGVLLDICTRVKKQDLPVGPVLDRIDQGLSKGKPVPEVISAAQRFSEKEAEARPIVDAQIKQGLKDGNQGDREKAIEAVARTLEQSVPQESISGIGKAVQKKKGTLVYYTDAVNSVTYLTAKGMSGERASKLVTDAVNRGASDKDLDALVKRAEGDQKRASVRPITEADKDIDDTVYDGRIRRGTRQKAQ